eukprot:scpid98539/ scgid15531/ 
MMTIVITLHCLQSSQFSSGCALTVSLSQCLVSVIMVMSMILSTRSTSCRNSWLQHTLQGRHRQGRVVTRHLVILYEFFLLIMSTCQFTPVTITEASKLFRKIYPFKSN